MNVYSYKYKKVTLTAMYIPACQIATRLLPYMGLLRAAPITMIPTAPSVMKTVHNATPNPPAQLVHFAKSLPFPFKVLL
jgi:hypothetical protein